MGAVQDTAQSHSRDKERCTATAEAIMDLCPRGQELAHYREAIQDVARKSCGLVTGKTQRKPSQDFERRRRTARWSSVTQRSRLGPSGTSHGDIRVRREVAQICPKVGSRCEASLPSTKRKEHFRTRQDRRVGSVSIAASERQTLASPDTLLLSLHA